MNIRKNSQSGKVIWQLRLRRSSRQLRLSGKTYTMSEDSRRVSSDAKQNDREPDFFGYYKHAALDLFSQKEDVRLIFSGLDSELSGRTYSGTEAGRFCASDLLWNEGLSDFKQERLKILLNQSSVALNQEVDEMHGRILTLFQIYEDLKETELSSPSEDLAESESSGEQKSFISAKVNKLAGQPQASRKACEDFQALLLDVGLEGEDAVDKCFSDILTELGQMEQNLEEYLNILASKCRLMTPAEKQLLGQRIHKLPTKALDRIVEIICGSKSSEKQIPDKIHVDLEEEDNVTLWRLHFYVKAAARANKS